MAVHVVTFPAFAQVEVFTLGLRYAGRERMESPWTLDTVTVERAHGRWAGELVIGLEERGSDAAAAIEAWFSAMSHASAVCELPLQGRKTLPDGARLNITRATRQDRGYRYTYDGGTLKGFQDCYVRQGSRLWQLIDVTTRRMRAAPESVSMGVGAVGVAKSVRARIAGVDVPPSRSTGDFAGPWSLQWIEAP
ncbi:MAG: hypothetical protein OXQ28_11370 [Acidobacteriota bacterium]|nr:hypothetical protein [Acidobacteriota bacterium]